MIREGNKVKIVCTPEELYKMYYSHDLFYMLKNDIGIVKTKEYHGCLKKGHYVYFPMLYRKMWYIDKILKKVK